MGKLPKPTWRGPHSTREVAEGHAQRISDLRQVPVVVWFQKTDKKTDDATGYHVAYESDQTEGDDRVFTAQPDSKKAKPNTWPVVKMVATTDQVLRDIEALNWRQLADRQALQAGVATQIRPYKVLAGIKKARFYGRSITLYTLIVRRNPFFPHDQLAQPDQSQEQPK